MAELVHFNMEQMLPFFDKLKDAVNPEFFNHLRSKRQQFEYKIASKKRNFDDFKNYVDHEMKMFNHIKTLKIDGAKSLRTDQKRLIERILKQMVTHFQSELRSFIFAIVTCHTLKNTSLEMTLWRDLLTRHGQNNVSLYITAAYYAMHGMLITDENYEDYKLKLERDRLKRRNKTENNTKNIELLTEKTEDTKYFIRDKYTNWTQDIFASAFKEFPGDKALLRTHLGFQIDKYIYQQNISEDRLKVLGDCKDGRVIEVLLCDILQRHSDDAEYLAIILYMVETQARQIECDALNKIRELVASSITPEPMCVDEPTPAVSVDPYDYFVEKYPNPRYVRSVSPKNAAGDLIRYLESAIEKMVSGQLNKEEEMAKIRRLMDWVLTDDDWSHDYIDLWWQYYEAERQCGDYLKASLVLDRAEQHLNGYLLAVLESRRMKSQQCR